MTSQTTNEDHAEYEPCWRDLAPSLLLLLAIAAIMSVVCVVWTHYLGPLPLEP